MTNELAARRSLSAKQGCLVIHLFSSGIGAERLRAVKAARSRRTPKSLRAKSSHTRLRVFVIPSSFDIRASSFLRPAALHGNWFSQIIYGDHGKNTVCDA